MRQLLTALGISLDILIVLGLCIAVAKADSLPDSQGFKTQQQWSSRVNSHGHLPATAQHHGSRIQQFYVVTERNPVTGDTVGAPRRFSSRLEATEYRESLRTAAWVVWRYVGIGEPLRSMRFSNRMDAEEFVRAGGPARQGLLGSLLLTKETRILPARVSLEVENVRGS